MKEQPLITPNETKVLARTDETKFAASGIVSRTILNTAHSRTILFGFAEGQELSEHTSTQHALVQILSGECEFNLDGKIHMHDQTNATNPTAFGALRALTKTNAAPSPRLRGPDAAS